MNTGNIKVSILMPSLNVVPYIKQSLESVVKQTLKEIEIICIDAGSTDGTLEIIKEIASNDPRVKIINSDIKSYGYQMNLGLKEACGEYIGIVETDDFVELNAFEELYGLVKKNDAQIVKADCYAYDTKTDTDRKAGNLNSLPVDRLFNPKDYKRLLYRAKTIWSAIYSRQFLLDNNIRFLESSGASYQDIDFYIKTFVCADRMVLTDKAYVHYRNDNDESSVFSKEKTFCVCDEYEEVAKFLDDRIFLKKEYEKAVKISKARDYIWNYKRLEGENKEIFYRVCNKDFEYMLDSKIWGLYNCINDHGIKDTINLLFNRGK